MIHICVVKITKCVYGQFHQDFDGGFQDGVATITTKVYCDSIEEITFREIHLLKGYAKEETHEFEWTHSDIFSPEYEDGRCILSEYEVKTFLDELNSLCNHYVYSKDVNLCTYDVSRVKLEVEKIYEEIAQQSLEKIAIEDNILNKAKCQYSFRIAKIKEEERNRRFSFFKNEILSNRLFYNKLIPQTTKFPIELAVESHDIELFHYILGHARNGIFDISTCSFLEWMHHTIPTASILCFAQNYADRKEFEYICDELIRVTNHCVKDEHVKSDRLNFITSKLDYAKALTDEQWKDKQKWPEYDSEDIPF